jgi:hypothetical protein
MRFDVFSTVHHSIELFQSLLSTGVLCSRYRERRYQMLCEYNFLPEDGHVNARNMSRIIV